MSFSKTVSGEFVFLNKDSLELHMRKIRDAKLNIF